MVIIGKLPIAFCVLNSEDAIKTLKKLGFVFHYNGFNMDGSPIYTNNYLHLYQDFRYGNSFNVYQGKDRNNLQEVTLDDLIKVANTSSKSGAIAFAKKAQTW